MQISNLPASNSFSSTDVLSIEINGVTYKVTGATLAAALHTLGNYLTPDNVANNLTTTAAGSVLDARQGKALNDSIAQQAANIGIVETGSTCTHTGGIAAGQYVIWQGVLYTADVAISVGETLAASGGSKNLTACSDGGLNALNSKLTTEEFNVPQTTISANSYSNIDINVSKTGYTPKSVMEWVINGTGAVVAIYIGMISSTTARLRLRNVASESQKVTGGHITVFYSKS